MSELSSIWYQRLRQPSFGVRTQFEPSTWFEPAKFSMALAGSPPILASEFEGNLDGKNPTQFITALSDASKLKTVRVSFGSDKQHGSEYILASDDGMAIIWFLRSSSYVSCMVSTTSPLFLESITKFFGDNLRPDDPEDGVVYTLAKTQNGYRLHRMGVAGVPLDRDNYTAKVLEGYDHVVKDLNTKTPCGRLIVLSGAPGTGKTFLVRSLLREAKEATFVLISPHLVSDLGDPDILPSLTEAREDLKGPIILILEDGDMCLVPRAADNMSTISSLLNLGDGILGALLDVRILVTTNAKKIEMDTAALRNGRLCKHIDVDALMPQDASAVFQRLTGTANFYRDHKMGKTLAEIYSDAREAGWKPPITKQSGSRNMDEPRSLVHAKAAKFGG